MSSGESGSGTWGDWFAAAKFQALDLASKAQVMAEQATKVAQEKAILLAKQAQEMQNNYDISVATSMIYGNSPASSNQSAGNQNNFKLTREDLSKLDFTYITDNIIAMAFPQDKSLPGNHEDCNDINVVAAYLHRRHKNRFMIWNISEETYDYSRFNDQVLEYKFPGHPAPPLGLLFKICTSVESWLDADPQNVAIVHCLTGKGRTATLLACLLAWLGEADSPSQALTYIASRRYTTVEYLTIPSQRRYLQYFSNLLDGVKPSPQRLRLRRVIISPIPPIGEHPVTGEKGFCPYVQLFKNGKLIASAAPSCENPTNNSSGGTSSTASSTPQLSELRWIGVGEGSVSFKMDLALQGDILLRVRHCVPPKEEQGGGVAGGAGVRVSLFRAAFHTGYISGGVLRLTRGALDGTGGDGRYSSDFFLDLIFGEEGNSSGSNASTGNNTSTLGLAGEGSADGEGASGEDKLEQALYRDPRLWEGVRKNRGERKKKGLRGGRKIDMSATEAGGAFRIAPEDLSP
eukprot:gene29185-35224_t